MTHLGGNKQDGSEAGNTPRRNRPEPVALGSRALAAPAFVRKGFSDPTLVLRWDEIAGSEVARLARPIRLSAGADGGTLTLKAEPGASVFLQHETRSLCDRINTYLGRSAVNRLRFVDGPMTGRRDNSVPRSQSGTIPSSDPSLAFHGTEDLHKALLALARRRGTSPD